MKKKLGSLIRIAVDVCLGARAGADVQNVGWMQVSREYPDHVTNEQHFVLVPECVSGPRVCFWSRGVFLKCWLTNEIHYDSQTVSNS